MLIEVHEKSESINKLTKKRGEGRTNEFTGIILLVMPGKKERESVDQGPFFPLLELRKHESGQEKEGLQERKKKLVYNLLLKEYVF